MRRAWWMTAIGMAAAAMMTAAGCQSSVNVSGGDCPATMPSEGDPCTPRSAGETATCDYVDGPCQMYLFCTNHEWSIEDAVCTPAAVDCWAASDGDICAIPGDSCGEDEGCGNGFLNECGADHHWHMSESFGGDCCDCCGGVEACPASPPVEGEYCDPCYDQPSCSYEGFCGGGTATCGPDYVWHTMYTDCPPPAQEPCSVYTTDADCGLDPNCRWLWPGCMGPALPQAGCYPMADCTPTSCEPGLTCQPVDFDPCYNLDCNDCSDGAFVCLP